MSPPPAETIRRYLDDHGGETDATLGHLLTSFGVTDEDNGGRDRIATGLNQAGIYTDRPISFLQPDDGLHLSTSPPPPAGEPGPTVGDEFERISIQERRAGWYQDPMSRDHLRWWDGAAWTDVTRPVAAPAPYIPAPPAPPAGPPAASSNKRWWVSGLVVLLVAALAAGITALVITSRDGDKGAAAKPQPHARTAARSHAPASFATVGDALTLKGSDTTLRARVTGVIDSLSGGEFDSPSSGKRFVGVQVALRNTGSREYSDSVSNGSTLILKGNEQADSTILTGGDCTSNFGSDLKLAPGDIRSGCIPFEVPQGARLRTFQFTPDSGFAGDTGEWRLPSSPPATSPSQGTTPVPNTPPPAPTYSACGGSVMARDGSTTCPFAENAFWEYWTEGQPSTISVWSPTTATYYTLSCDTTADVVCTSDGDAGVKFSQASVDAYSQDQADQYAATHEVGPGD